MKFTDKITKELIGQVALLLVVMAGFSYIFLYQYQFFAHWVGDFRPAVLNWREPHHKPCLIFNPPWIFPLLYPLAMLPPRAGGLALGYISLLILAFYLRDTKKFAFIVTTPAWISLFLLGQLDGLLILAFMVPVAYSLPIIAIKPQGVFLAALRRLTWQSIAFAAVVFGLSILIWGEWWRSSVDCGPPIHQFDISLFPYSIPVGLALLYYGFKRDSDALLCWGSICFSPYFMVHSMLPALAATVKEYDNWRLWLILFIGTWGWFLAIMLPRAIYGWHP